MRKATYTRHIVLLLLAVYCLAACTPKPGTSVRKAPQQPVIYPDYTDITKQQFCNRMILRDAMLSHGFKPLDSEWWHFTLRDEPFPDTYFTFPVN